MDRANACSDSGKQCLGERGKHTTTMTAPEITQRLQRLEERLGSMEELLRRIDARTMGMEAHLDGTRESCENMDRHIGFVEGVYGAVCHPLSYLASRFGSGPLPALRVGNSPPPLEVRSGPPRPPSDLPNEPPTR